MEKIELTPSELEFAGKLWKLTEEEKKRILPNLKPMQKRFIKSFGRFYGWKIIQEVEWAKCCPLQAKPGDKIVYTGMGIILPDECSFGTRSTRGFCTWAVMAMLPFVYSCSDRLMDNLDLTPRGIDYGKCSEMEPAEGGMGEVRFKVYAIKEQVTTKRFFQDSRGAISPTERAKYFG